MKNNKRRIGRKVKMRKRPRKSRIKEKNLKVK